MRAIAWKGAVGMDGSADAPPTQSASVQMRKTWEKYQVRQPRLADWGVRPVRVLGNGWQLGLALWICASSTCRHCVVHRATPRAHV